MTIRWPWVSRSYHEDVLRRADADALATVDVLRGQITAANERAKIAEHSAERWESIVRQWAATFEEAKEMLERSEARYDTLLSRYQQLKLQGFSEPAVPVVRPPVAPDPIKRAIAQRAGTNRALRENMERQVAQDRLMGKSDEEILSAIIAGVSGEDLILSEAGLMSP